MATPPYVEQPLPRPDDGAALVRPSRPIDRVMRVSLRFIGFGLVVLGGLVLGVTDRLEGADAAITVLLGLVCVVCGLAAWWWMGRAGVHRVEIRPDRIVLYRAGFAGMQRRRVVQRAGIERIEADAIGAHRTARWRVWLVTADARIELATLYRSGPVDRPVKALAERLGTLFTPRE